MGHYINIFTTGNDVSMKWIKKGEIDKLVNHIKENIGKTSSADSQSAVEPDIPDQIKKLSDLKDQGVLSEEEFESKKQELLSKM